MGNVISLTHVKQNFLKFLQDKTLNFRSKKFHVGKYSKQITIIRPRCDTKYKKNLWQSSKTSMGHN